MHISQVTHCDDNDDCISRVPDQNGVSLLYIMLEIHHSGREPSNFVERLPCETNSVVLNKYKYQTIKPMETRPPEQHIPRQSCSNSQPSSEEGYKR